MPFPLLNWNTNYCAIILGVEMGGIWGSREFFSGALTEIAGYKAGVVLTANELFDLMREQDVANILDPDGPGGGRVHSTSFEEAVVYLLYKLGNTSSPRNVSISIELFHKYRGSPQAAVLEQIIERWLHFLKAAIKQRRQDQSIDPSPFLYTVYQKLGRGGASIAMELIDGWQRDLHRSAWGAIRNFEWLDTVELRGLFQSAGLETQHAQFFDQRYIDYLSQNFTDMDRMHWRKFEGLTAEFFQREGFHVQLGPGSNDGGIDLRIYPDRNNPEMPPMIIVQCKRQKAKIDKTLVKAVYADVLDEGAGSGLIVTTSTLSPGAEAVRTVRNYPVDVADRTTLRTCKKPTELV